MPAAALDRERAVLREQASGSGKSEEIVARMVEGRLRKFYEEAVLLDQIFVIDGETRVSKIVEQRRSKRARRSGLPASFVLRSAKVSRSRLPISLPRSGRR